MNAKALSIMRYHDDINTEHNMKSVLRAAVAQWTKGLTRNGQTRSKNANILLLQMYSLYSLLYSWSGINT